MSGSRELHLKQAHGSCNLTAAWGCMISLGAAAGFNRKDGSWEEGVLEATGGKGVDLILDCVGT